MSLGRCSIVHAGLALLSLVGLFSVMGCSGSPSAEQRSNNAMAQAGISKGSVYPLAGRVTIDGQAPQLEQGYRLAVVLNDISKPDADVTQRPYVMCDPQGNFFFSTYDKGDGIVPGTYVVAFGVYRYKMKNGLLAPDKLNNLYNDPEKNAQIPQFKIEHKEPGKKDYEFDLQIAGKEPITKPGPKALTEITFEKFGQ